MDDASFAQVKPVYGLVFLFKWTGEKDERATVEASSQPGLFFARQVHTKTPFLFVQRGKIRYGRESFVIELNQNHNSVKILRKSRKLRTRGHADGIRESAPSKVDYAVRMYDGNSTRGLAVSSPFLTTSSGNI